MNSKKKIGILAGSLRKGSYSRLMAEEMAAMLPPAFEAQLIDIAGLALYNQDFDTEGSPEHYASFRAAVAEMDGFIFITPEYNRSMPAVLKNALDVASRPWGQSKWGKKRAMAVGITPGTLGGAGAVFELKKVLSFLDVSVMGQPEAYISRADTLFDQDGKLKAESRAFVQGLVDAFVGFMG